MNPDQITYSTAQSLILSDGVQAYGQILLSIFGIIMAIGVGVLIFNYGWHQLTKGKVWDASDGKYHKKYIRRGGKTYKYDAKYGHAYYDQTRA